MLGLDGAGCLLGQRVSLAFWFYLFHHPLPGERDFQQSFPICAFIAKWGLGPGTDLRSRALLSITVRGAHDAVPDMVTHSAQYEPVAWWWTRKPDRAGAQRTHVDLNTPDGREITLIIQSLDQYCD
jgi:hypothetical protein